MAKIEEQIEEGETIVYRAEPSRIVLLVPAIGWGLLTAALLVAWVVQREGEHWLLFAALAAAGVGLVHLGIRTIVLNSHEYVLTNRRLIRQTGIVTKRSIDAYLDKINNVEHVQTLLGRLFDYGDMEIDTASETGTSRFPLVAKPLRFKQAILSMKHEREERGWSVPALSQPSGAERLRELRRLLDDGLITDEEFAVKRDEIVRSL